MLRHAVAHVALEPVARMGGAEPRHEPIAGHLGDDRGRRDRGDKAVAADHGLAFAGDVDPVAAVDEHELRLDRQCRDRARQRPERGVADVVAVDPARRRERDRDLGAGADLCVQRLARLLGQLLGIIESARDAFGIEDHRRRDHRARERAAPRLVAARDRHEAALERAPLARKGRAELGLGKRQTLRRRGTTHGRRSCALGAASQPQAAALKDSGDNATEWRHLRTDRAARAP